MSTQSSFQHNATRALTLMWVFWASQLTLLGMTQLAEVAPSQPLSVGYVVAGLLFWAFKALPLLIAIPWLLKRSHKAASWLAYACLFYFITWMLVAFTPERAQLGALGALSSTGLFVSCMLFTRWEKRIQI